MKDGDDHFENPIFYPFDFDEELDMFLAWMMPFKMLKFMTFLKSMIISMELFYKKALIWRLILMKAHTMEWTWIIKNTMMQCWRILKREWIFLTSYFWTCWIKVYNKRCLIYNYNSKFHGSMFGEWFNSFSLNLQMWSIF